MSYLKQKQILLVDDEQELLDMVVSILKNDGYQNIQTATSVQQALKAVENNSPELAILLCYQTVTAFS